MIAFRIQIITGEHLRIETSIFCECEQILTGNVDPQKIIDLAPGEMNNLPGFEAWNEGATSTLGEYPAYQLGGTWQSDVMTKITAQKTVVIPVRMDCMFFS